MDDSDKSSNTSEHGQQHNSEEAEVEGTFAHKIPEEPGETGDFGDNENGTAAAQSSSPQTTTDKKAGATK